jgi:hypothetical protein
MVSMLRGMATSNTKKWKGEPAGKSQAVYLSPHLYDYDYDYYYDYLPYFLGVSCRRCHRFFMFLWCCSIFGACHCITRLLFYLERDFCIVLGTMPVYFQSRPEQLIDNTVDAIRFA